LTDYFHTAVILIIACYFSVKAFSDNQIGSVGNLFELLKAAGERHPISGNQNGTYLTMTSKSVSKSPLSETFILLTIPIRPSSSVFSILVAILVLSL
jgi:Na+/proline symporter